MSKTWKVAGINFDHMHMGDLLRMVYEHPNAEIAGVCDEQRYRMQPSIDNFGIPAEHIFTDYRAGLEGLNRYVTPTPLAAKRLQIIDDEHLTFRLKTPGRTVRPFSSCRHWN